MSNNILKKKNKENNNNYENKILSKVVKSKIKPKITNTDRGGGSEIMTSKSSTSTATTAADIPDPRRWKALVLLSLFSPVCSDFRHIDHRSSITNHSAIFWLLSN